MSDETTKQKNNKETKIKYENNQWEQLGGSYGLGHLSRILRESLGDEPETTATLTEPRVDVPHKDEDVTQSLNEHNLKAQIASNEAYEKIVKDVVDFSKENLQDIHTDKQELRSRLVEFCINILGAQLAILFFLLICTALFESFAISDKVLVAIMTSIFVETLGAIIVMIKFAFQAKEEVEMVGILNAVVKNYQKYKEYNVNTYKDEESEE